MLERRINPYRRLRAGVHARQEERLPFLTRNVGIGVFAQELGLVAELPAVERELADYVGPRAIGMRALHLVRNGPTKVKDTIWSLDELIAV